ncbi:MAG: gamma-glutamyltransferase [Alphaproteobacteria bacterium]|nr:gamma-glutamyltransferase [Alphaproteobacteria bacterium]
MSSLLLLSGCTFDLAESVGLDSGSRGAGANALTVGDEPYAVQAGAQVLAAGGSAADAATAMYFALAVTYPVAAGLGGGGICIVHDPASGQVEEFDFLARDAGGGGSFAVPGNVRGFAMMQGIYGRIPWQRDIAPGEGYAAAGFPISHALADRLKAAQAVLRLDASLAGEFLDESGNAKPPGTIVHNRELAQTLAAIRTDGPNAFYRGQTGARLLAYAQQQGGNISVQEFARYAARRTQPQAMRLGDLTVYLPSRAVGAGAFAGTLLDALNSALMTPSGSGDLQASVGVAVKQTLAQFGVTSLPQDLGATGFAATDGTGQSVACAVTLNGPFGAGRNVAETGVTLAAAPGSNAAGLAAAFLTPVVAANGSGPAMLAGAGAGGPNGTASMGYALARLSRGDSMTRRSDLRTTGVAPFDTVNAIICQSGTCVALPDPGGNGLGAVATP